MERKYVFFNNTEDIVAHEVAEYIQKIGYSPVECGDFDDMGDDLVGAILINPPVANLRGGIEDTTDEMWKNARDAFVLPMLSLTQKIGSTLAKNRKGSLIYLNSIHAEKPIGDGFLYTAGCAAVQALCREAALIYGSRNVGCYNVMRGIVEGEDGYFASEYSPIHHSGHLRFPKEKLPPANSLNELCAYLLGGGAYILNGADLRADEGFSLYYGKSGYYR